jgi:hypothetical protein
MTTSNLVSFTALTPALQQSILEGTAESYMQDNDWIAEFESSLIRPALAVLGFHNAEIDFSLDHSHHRYVKLVSADFKYTRSMTALMKKQYPSHNKFNQLAAQWLVPNKKAFYGYTFTLKGGYINDLEHDRLGNEFRHDIEPYETAAKAFLEDLNCVLLDLYTSYYDHTTSEEQIKQYLLNNCQFTEDGVPHWND